MSQPDFNGPNMPALFIGHGSPMNALADNEYSRTLKNLGENSLPRPQAILVISAHWMTEGTWVTHMQRPKTIHDFYGFPRELFEVQYPAPGSPELAELVKNTVTGVQIQLDDEDWGFDHGTWSVLKHLYPNADVPVVQLSLDMTKPGKYHFELGEKLRALRSKGVLILGSGNIVHNLRRLNWSEHAAPAPWAIEFDEWVKSKLMARDFSALYEEYIKTEAGRLSVPTHDHYYPFLYILGSARREDQLHFDYEEIQNATISMRSVRFA